MNKFNKFLNVFFVLIVLSSFSYAWGCDDEHCYTSAESIYGEKLGIKINDAYKDGFWVSYILDLNYIGGMSPDVHFGEKDVNWFTYKFNNWYTNSNIDIGNSYTDNEGNIMSDVYIAEDILPGFSKSFCTINPSFRLYKYATEEQKRNMENICAETITEEECLGNSESLTYIDQCIWDKADFQNTNFVGLPFYIDKCYIDCNYQGDSNTCEKDDGGLIIFDYAPGSRLNNVNVNDDGTLSDGWDVVSVSGNYYTNSTESNMLNYPDLLISRGKVRVGFNYFCENDASESTVQVYCELAPNKMYRHNNASDDSWTYEDILPVFMNGKNYNNLPVQTCTKTIVDMTNEEYNNSLPNVGNINSTTFNDIYDVLNRDLNNIQTQGEFIKQLNSNQELKNLRLKFAFQNGLLSLVDAVASIILFLYYVFLISYMTSFIFILFPKTTRKIIDTLKEFGRVKRY